MNVSEFEWLLNNAPKEEYWRNKKNDFNQLIN